MSTSISTSIFSFISTPIYLYVSDGGECGKTLSQIYPRELAFKVEHQGSYASFLDLKITIEEITFVYKLFVKRNTFSFSVVRIPYIDSKIPQNIFYSITKEELLRITSSTLCLDDFLTKTKNLLKFMQMQGSKGLF